MRVVLVSATVPNVAGGGRSIVDWTADAIRDHGHHVDVFLLPFPTTPRPTLSALVGMRSFPFAGTGDRLVAIRWPAHLVRHDNKATWFIHHYRELFDLWHTEHRAVPSDGEGRAYREAVRRVDTTALAESADLFTNSHIVRDRVRQFNGLEAQPLFPPLGGDTSHFRNDSTGDFILYASRVTPIKRQLLAVQAMCHTESAVKLIIAGQPESPAYAKALTQFVSEHRLEGRVDLRFGWLDEADKVDLMARCLAVAYIPFDEDSNGYPTLEASHSSKPVVTLTDSGGSLEFVRDGIDGLVTSPDPRSLARAFDLLHEERSEAERLGSGCRDRRAMLGIDWATVVPRLLGTSP